MKTINYILIPVLILICSSIVYAQGGNIDYSYPSDPWVDRVLSLNQTGVNITFANITADQIGANGIIIDGNLTAYFSNANMSWDRLYNYPVACPVGSYLTQLNDSVTCTNGYIQKYASGVFNGSLYTTQMNSTGSDSNALFQVISDTRGTPQFQVQNGGVEQASFITRSFMVVNQNNTLLNDSQNNLCSSWGFQEIDCNTATSGADFGVTDDIEAIGLIYTKSGVRSYVDRQSAFFVASQNMTPLNNGSNGTFTVSNNYFCDYVTDSFTPASKGWININDISSEFEGAWADINAYVNSSCLELHNNPGWLTDFSGVTWRDVNSPDVAILKGGFAEYYVGDKEESKFKIRAKNLYANTAFALAVDSKIDGTSAMETTSDANGFSSTAHKITMGSSSTMNGGSLSMLKLLGVASNLNGTDGVYIDMQLVGVPVAAGHFDGMHMPSGLTHLIEVGSADDFNKSYYESTDITTEMKAGTPTQVFILNNDVLYVGSDTNFTSVSFTLTTPGTANALFTYSYCDENGVYQPLLVTTDTTNGFLQSGALSFDNPTDRGVCHNETDGTPFADTNNYTYIALTRTRNNIVNPPILERIAVSGVSTNMFMSEDILRLNPVDTEPDVCGATTLGAIYFDISEDDMCQCASGGWEVIRDGSECS